MMEWSPSINLTFLCFSTKAVNHLVKFCFWRVTRWRHSRSCPSSACLGPSFCSDCTWSYTWPAWLRNQRTDFLFHSSYHQWQTADWRYPHNPHCHPIQRSHCETCCYHCCCAGRWTVRWRPHGRGYWLSQRKRRSCTTAERADNVYIVIHVRKVFGWNLMIIILA